MGFVFLFSGASTILQHLTSKRLRGNSDSLWGKFDRNQNCEGLLKKGTGKNMYWELGGALAIC